MVEPIIIGYWKTRANWPFDLPKLGRRLENIPPARTKGDMCIVVNGIDVHEKSKYGLSGIALSEIMQRNGMIREWAKRNQYLLVGIGGGTGAEWDDDYRDVVHHHAISALLGL